MRNKFFIIFGILAIVFIAFFVGRDIGKGSYLSEEKAEIDNSLNTNVKIIQFYGNRTFFTSNGLRVDCSGLDLELTSICLNYYVNQIFNYTLTDDLITLTEYELRTRGGDCKEWSDFIEREFLKYGYKTTRVKINVIDGELDHVFIVANDEERYCIMDMTRHKCFSYDDIVVKKF